MSKEKPQTAEELFEYYVKSNNDICQHIATLRAYAHGLDIVVELGVRSIVSTWALLLGLPKRLISVDMAHPSQYKDHDPMGGNLDLVYSESKRLGVQYEFLCTNSVTAPIPECDMIFFDTVHTREHLSAELAAHGTKATRYLAFHDTETFKGELMGPITDFLNAHQDWQIDRHYENNNGLTILKRI
jgi:hypothetical protein